MHATHRPVILILIIGFVLLILAICTYPVRGQASADCANTSDVPQSECEALVTIYNATGGSNWITSTNWLSTGSPTDVCTWYGVICSAGRVIWLNLGDNQLTGTIPVEVAQLTELKRLDMDGNQLTGTIPAELGTLIELFTLDLDRNQLSGEIPESLGALPMIDSIFLDDNQLTGTIPIALSNASTLRLLQLEKNQLSGSAPTEFGGLTNLEELQLSDNNLSGVLPFFWTNLSLTRLWFDGTGICVPDDNAIQSWLSSIADLQSSNIVCTSVFLPMLVK